MTPTNVLPDAKSIDPRSRPAMGAGGDRASAPDQTFDALMSDLGDDGTAGESATVPSPIASLPGALKSQAASTGASAGSARPTVPFAGAMIALLASQILQTPASSSESGPTRDLDDKEQSADPGSDSVSPDTLGTPNAADPLSRDIMAMLVSPMIAQASTGAPRTSSSADTGAPSPGTGATTSLAQRLAGVASTAAPLISNVSVETHFALPASANMPAPVMVGGAPSGTGTAASDHVADTTSSVDPIAAPIGADLIPPAAATPRTVKMPATAGISAVGEPPAGIAAYLEPTATQSPRTVDTPASDGNLALGEPPAGIGVYLKPTATPTARTVDTPASDGNLAVGEPPAGIGVYLEPTAAPTPSIVDTPASAGNLAEGEPPAGIGVYLEPTAASTPGTVMPASAGNLAVGGPPPGIGAYLEPTAAPTPGTSDTPAPAGNLSGGHQSAVIGAYRVPTPAATPSTGAIPAPAATLSLDEPQTDLPTDTISVTPSSSLASAGSDLLAADTTGAVAPKSGPAVIMPAITASDRPVARGTSANADLTTSQPSAQPTIPIPHVDVTTLPNAAESVVPAVDAAVNATPETSPPQALAQTNIGLSVNPVAIPQGPTVPPPAQDASIASLVATTPGAMTGTSAMPVAPQPRAASATVSSDPTEPASEEMTLTVQPLVPQGSSPAAPAPKPTSSAAPLQASRPATFAMPQAQIGVTAKTGTPQPNMFVSAQIPTSASPEVAKSDAASGPSQPDTTSIAGTIQAIAGAVTQLADTAATEASAAPVAQTTPMPAATTIAPARTMTLQLSPADLGTVNVRLHLSGNALDVQLSVSDEQTLGMISRERDTLSNAINDQTYSLNTLVIQGTDAPTPVSGGNHATQDNPGGNPGSDPRPDQRQGSNSQDPPGQGQTGRGSQQHQPNRSNHDMPPRGSSAGGDNQLFV